MPRPTPMPGRPLPDPRRDALSAELDRVHDAIDVRNELLRRDIQAHTEALTRLHRRADELRAQLGLGDEVLVAGDGVLRLV